MLKMNFSSNALQKGRKKKYKVMMMTLYPKQGANPVGTEYISNRMNYLPIKRRVKLYI
jgi:hypothetical protein